MSTARLRLALLTFAQAPWPVLFGMAGIGFFLTPGPSGPGSLSSICQSLGDLRFGERWTSQLAAVLTFSSPWELMTEWAVMLLAMMPPLLAAPLMHVWRSSLPSRRLRAVAGFCCAYGSVWMLAGAALVGVAMALGAAFSQWALTAALALATLWSTTPLQRLALNRGHVLKRIGLFGWRADWDCLAFGTRHGVWCVVSCWPWMLLPLVESQWHLLFMIAAGAVMFIERISMPAKPRWRCPLFVALGLSVLIKRSGLR